MRDRYDLMELPALQEEAKRRGLSIVRNRNQLKNDLRRSDMKRKWQGFLVMGSLIVLSVGLVLLIFFLGLPPDDVRWGVVIAIVLGAILEIMAFIRL